MGRSRNRKPPRLGVSRRTFLKGAAGAAFAAAPLAPAIDLARAADPTDVRFLHGVASGDPRAHKVILWTRVTPPSNGPVPVTVTVARDTAMTDVVQTGQHVARASHDYTVKFDVGGLKPATTYYYQFSAGGVLSPIGRTRTLPVGDVDRLRMGVAVCASLAHGYFNAYKRLAERTDLDLIIHLGDYIYEYADGGYGDARTYEPSNEIVSLTDYRQRHAQYKREPELMEMHRQHPIIAIWDDHEFANNSSSTGAENHDPATEGEWDVRVTNALQAYYEWMPTRPPDKSDLRHNYRKFQLGNLAELFMLEERVGARAAQVKPNIVEVGNTGFGDFLQNGEFADPERQLLGADQEAWLFSGLRSSSAQWKLLGQGVMMAQLKLLGLPNATGLSQYFNNDQWDGYNPARERLFAAIKGDATNPAVGNVVVLTGDIHSSWAADLAPDPNNPVPALGGYAAATGKGALGVEFVCTSVTSPFPNVTDVLSQLPADNPLAGVGDSPVPLEVLPVVLKTQNCHFKYIDLLNRGYMVLDVDKDRVQGEWWYVDTIATRSDAESLGAAYKSLDGTPHMRKATASAPKPNPPDPAP